MIRRLGLLLGLAAALFVPVLIPSGGDAASVHPASGAPRAVTAPQATPTTAPAAAASPRAVSPSPERAPQVSEEGQRPAPAAGGVRVPRTPAAAPTPAPTPAPSVGPAPAPASPSTDPEPAPQNPSEVIGREIDCPDGTVGYVTDPELDVTCPAPAATP